MTSTSSAISDICSHTSQGLVVVTARPVRAHLAQQRDKVSGAALLGQNRFVADDNEIDVRIRLGDLDGPLDLGARARFRLVHPNAEDDVHPMPRGGLWHAVLALENAVGPDPCGQRGGRRDRRVNPFWRHARPRSGLSLRPYRVRETLGKGRGASTIGTGRAAQITTSACRRKAMARAMRAGVI